MFRKENSADIIKEQFDRIVSPHINRVDAFLEEFIIPELAAFCIADGYNHSAIWEASLEVHINTTLDMFNHKIKNTKKLTDNVKKNLLVKYGLEVNCEKPLSFKTH